MVAVRASDPVNRPTPRALGLEVDDAVEAVMAHALAVNVADRYPTAGEFWTALRLAAAPDAPANTVRVFTQRGRERDDGDSERPDVGAATDQRVGGHAERAARAGEATARRSKARGDRARCPALAGIGLARAGLRALRRRRLGQARRRRARRSAMAIRIKKTTCPATMVHWSPAETSRWAPIDMTFKFLGSRPTASRSTPSAPT